MSMQENENKLGIGPPVASFYIAGIKRRDCRRKPKDGRRGPGRFCSADWLAYGSASVFLPRPVLISRAGDVTAPKPRWCVSYDRFR